MNHENARGLLPNLAIGDIEPITRWQLRRHIAACPICTRDLQELTELYAALAERYGSVAPQTLPGWESAPSPNEWQRREEKEALTCPLPFAVRFVLPALGALSFLSLFLMPMSAGIVQEQLSRLASPFTGQYPSKAQTDFEKTKTARIKTLTYPAVVGEILDLRQDNDTEGGYRVPVVQQLDRLVAQYPDKPELCAFLLTRPEMALREKRSRELVRVGERLAPRNALFPLLSAQRISDPDSFSVTILKASEKPQFDTYFRERIYAVWAYRQEIKGGASALDKLEGLHYVGDYTFNHLREVGRRAVDEAISLEKQGKKTEGLRLRLALVRIAETMQNSTSDLPALFIAHALTTATLDRPLGIAEPNSKKPLTVGPGTETRGEQQRRKIEHFEKTLRLSPQSKEMQYIRTTLAKTLEFITVWDRVIGETSMFPPGIEILPWLLFTGLLVLLDGVGLILLHGFAWLLSRTRLVRHRTYLPTAITWGILVGMVPALAFIGFNSILTTGAIFLSAALLLPSIGVTVCIRSGGRRNAASNIGRMLLTAVLVASMGFAALWVMRGPLTIVHEHYYLLIRWHGFSQGNETLLNFLQLKMASGEGDAGQIPAGWWTLALMVSLLVPLCLVVGAAIRAWKRQMPAAVCIIEETARYALPLAGVVLLMYSGLMLYTAGRDRSLQREMDRMVQNEYAYYRSLDRR